MKQARVLIIDDSALVRQILSQGLATDPAIEVVGVAQDPYVARDLIVTSQPNVLTLDVEMPRMDGIEFLRRLMPQFPLPVIMVSSLTDRGAQITLDALEAGAIDFVTKPKSNVASGLNNMIHDLCEKVKMAAQVDVSYRKGQIAAPRKSSNFVSRSLAKSTHKVVAIGASTGGTEALRKVANQFPSTMPGVVVVQHMPAGFTKMFAQRLNDECSMEVKEAETGDQISPGLMLIAPGEHHMKVMRSGGIYRVECEPGPKVCGHCPSVEVLFQSVAKYVGSNAVGAMLTGMGSDGADGMLLMRQQGARTIAQDEKTSVVFGMPKVAFERGGAERLVAIEDIPSAIFNLLDSID
ncbi:MAG: chemotaxis response regulator protein-glutamate methylesterase [SAR324 cluster bacterium]|nr:chemotaxis response regulator protein-glutamate methylesterase [SAR324 cluster bacterium]